MLFDFINGIPIRYYFSPTQHKVIISTSASQDPSLEIPSLHVDSQMRIYKAIIQPGTRIHNLHVQCIYLSIIWNIQVSVQNYLRTVAIWPCINRGPTCDLSWVNIDMFLMWYSWWLHCNRNTLSRILRVWDYMLFICLLTRSDLGSLTTSVTRQISLNYAI